MYYYEPMKKETLTVETNEKGTIIYRNADGDFHNPHGPAIIHADGRKEHWINGEFRNPHGPAIVGSGSYKAYLINGQLHHPSGGPAIVIADSCKAY
jgi:hypothetical protein